MLGHETHPHPENAAPIIEVAELIGWTPERLANHILGETLQLFADTSTGRLEEFLGSIRFDTRQIAEGVLARVTDDTREFYGGQLPESFKAESRACGEQSFRCES